MHTCKVDKREVKVEYFEGVLNVFVSKNLHDVKDVFCFSVFHCCFKVSQSVEGYLS